LKLENAFLNAKTVENNLETMAAKKIVEATKDVLVLSLNVIMKTIIYLSVVCLALVIPCNFAINNKLDNPFSNVIHF
jgi:hypothetical protein